MFQTAATMKSWKNKSQIDHLIVWRFEQFQANLISQINTNSEVLMFFRLLKYIEIFKKNPWCFISISHYFLDNALLEYESHKRGRIYLRRLSGSECSAIASEVLLGTSKFSESSSSTTEECTEKNSRKKNKKDTKSYLNW